MTIIDHLSVGVSDLQQAETFYNAALGELNILPLAKNEMFLAFGEHRVEFLAMLPRDGNSHSCGNGTHICFVAPSRSAVDAFHAKALKNGGTCEGEPGPRAAYPIPDVYACFVRDPFGNKLEAIHNGFAK